MVLLKPKHTTFIHYDYILYFSGLITALIGFFVLYGWLTNNYILIQINKQYSPMQFNTALGFVLSGLGLISYIKYPKLVGVIGIIIILLGSLTFFEYIFGFNIGLDQLIISSNINENTAFPGRMAPNTAVYLSLIGIIFFLRSFDTKYKNTFVFCYMISAFLIAVGVIAVMGYALNISIAYGWGHWAQMAFHTAITFIIIGTGLTLYFWNNYYEKLNDKNINLPIAIVIIGFLIFILLWQYLVKHEYQKTSRVIASEGILIQRLLLTNLNTYDSIFQIIQNQYEVGEYSNLTVWQSNAKKFIKDMPALVALSLITNKNLTSFETSSVFQHKEDIENLEKCINTHNYNLDKKTIFIKNQFLCWILPYSISNHTGIAALVNINYLIQKIVAEVPDFSNYGLELYSDQTMIYAHNNTADDLKKIWEVKLPLNFNNLKLHLNIWPNQNIISSNSSWFPIASLFTGMLVTLLLALCIHMWQTVSESAKKLKNSENIFRNLLNTTSDGILIVNKKGIPYFANQSFLALTKYTLNELTNLAVEKLMPDRFRKNHINYRNEYIKSPITRMMGAAKNLLLLTKQGKEIPVEIGLNPIILDDETYILCSIHDMSQAKENENKLRQQSRYIQVILDITNAISSEENFEKAMGHCLNILCTEFNWSVGHIYLVSIDDNEKLIPSDIWWMENNKNYLPFYNQTMKTNLSYNVGLPGKVLATGSIVWIPDVLNQDQFPRRQSCLNCNLHAALAFPIKLENKIIAIFEFFSNLVLAQDNDVMNVTNIISGQISRFVENQNIHQQMKHYAYYDSLTNLMNRHAFNDAATRLLAESERDHKMFAVLYIDVDYFKDINDSFGHYIGDQVLIKVAQELKINLRSEDILGRLGGDEFVIILADIKSKLEAQVVMQKIINQFKKPMLISNHLIKTSVTIGISFYPESGSQMLDLLEQADKALLNAKNQRHK